MVNKEKVKEVIDKIRPQLQADGGDLELISIEEDGVVKIRLLGHCAGCMHAQETLTYGVEAAIRKFVPDVKAVVNVPY